MRTCSKRAFSIGVACILAAGMAMPTGAFAQGASNNAGNGHGGDVAVNQKGPEPTTPKKDATETPKPTMPAKEASEVPKPSTTVSSIKAVSTKQLKISWKKKKASSYQVQVALNKDFSYGQKSMRVKGKKTSCTIKNLKSGRVYYVRVRTCKKGKASTAYGGWSKVKSKRTGIYYDKGCYGSGLSSKKVAQVTAEVKRFVKTQVKGGMTDKQIVDAACDYIVKSKHVRADTNYSTPYHHYEGSAWAMFFYKHAACSGFSRGTKAMLEAAGLKVKHVNASKWTHQWLEVWCDGKKDLVDPFVMALFK